MIKLLGDNNQRNKISPLTTLVGLALQLFSSGCGPQCPRGPESEIYNSCNDSSDCGCLTTSYSSFDHERGQNLYCRGMTRYDGDKEKICVPYCVSTTYRVYDNTGPGCLVGKVTSARCTPDRHCAGGLSFESIPLQDYVGNSICAAAEAPTAHFSSELTDPEALERGIPDWYCIPYKGFAVEGELETVYHTY